MSVVTRDILRKVYPKREMDAHKYQFGSLLVIGGSKLYHGSPIFNAMGAYRTGVDLVTVVAPERAADIVASYRPDLITYPMDGEFFQEKHLKTVKNLAANCSAVLIGGGMGREPGTSRAIRKFLAGNNKPVVVDADALRAVKPSEIKSNFLLTPHKDEFRSLSGTEPLKKNVVKFARKRSCTVLLKGGKDVISDGRRTAENWTGNPYMTVGGTGDILAGMCGSLLAQGVPLFEAACAAAYINGRAGDIAASVKKQALIASDLLDCIEKVL